jgi:hypothetical protein
MDGKLEFCVGCGMFMNTNTVTTEGYYCVPCAKKMKRIGRICTIGLVLAFAGLMITLSGCASQPVGRGDGIYAPGDKVTAHMFTRFPEYEGEIVTVVDGFGWKWIKDREYNGAALRVYEIETSDGRRLAAQEFQLKKVK